jgi:eukaryotic translation initiation factor 2C
MAGNSQYRGYDILPVIAALNLILAAHPSRTGPGGGVMVGRNRFFFPSPSAPPVSLGGGLEAWKGFFSSVRVAYKQLMVNVNVCTTAFYTPGNLAEAMTTFERASFGGRFTAFVKGVRVKTTHLGYKKTVKNAKKETPDQHRFDCTELGGMVSVEEYFKRSQHRFCSVSVIHAEGPPSSRIPDQVALPESTSYRRRGSEGEPIAAGGM